MNSFRVGQKVVAISRPGLGLPSGRNVTIKVGTVLSIRGIQTAIRSDGVEQTGLLFEEVQNVVVPTTLGPWELDYDHRCFRPVVDPGTETGMSILRELLNTQDSPLEVEA